MLEPDELYRLAQTSVKVIKALSWIVFLAALAAFAGRSGSRGSGAGCCSVVGVDLLLVGIVLLIVRNVVGNYLVDALADGESIRDAAGAPGSSARPCWPTSRGP